MTTRIYLIRHAETIWNKEGRVQGFKDSPLTPLGEQQSQKLGHRMPGLKIELAFSSDSGRCIQTADLSLKGKKIPLSIRTEFRERNLGDWEGQIWQELQKKDPEGTKTYKTEARYKPPNGETFLELQTRAKKGLDRIREEHKGQSLAIFTSGGTARSLVMAELEAGADHWRQWTTWNTGVTLLEYRETKARLIYFNDTQHLS